MRLELSLLATARVASVITSHGRCESAEAAAAVCELGAIAPGAEARLALLLVRDGPGGISARAAAVSREEGDVRQWNDAADVVATVSTCTIVGTWGSDRLTGTPGRDYICGRPGSDRIHGGRGNDRIEAGSGADTVSGGAGLDSIAGGGGADVILVRDGAGDTVNCVTEQDTVVADRKDRVARDCERVLRR